MVFVSATVTAVPGRSSNVTCTRVRSTVTAHATITKIAEEGRFLAPTTDDGKELHLRAAGDVNFATLARQ